MRIVLEKKIWFKTHFCIVHQTIISWFIFQVICTKDQVICTTDQVILLQHWGEVHKGDSQKPKFNQFVVSRHESALDGQISEAVRIQHRGQVLNSVGVYNQSKLARLVVGRWCFLPTGRIPNIPTSLTQLKTIRESILMMKKKGLLRH